MANATPEWPRVRDLPEGEREAFSHWLFGQTQPWIEGARKQDGYYQHDYELWKSQDKPLEQRRSTWD